MVIRPKHVAVTEYNIQTSVALDGNPKPDLVHATGCKQPTLRLKMRLAHFMLNKEISLAATYLIGTAGKGMPIYLILYGIMK
jgi:hypothetical protein